MPDHRRQRRSKLPRVGAPTPARTALRRRRDHRHGRPAGRIGDHDIPRGPRVFARHPHRVGRVLSYALHGRGHQRRLRGLRRQRLGGGDVRGAHRGHLLGYDRESRVHQRPHLEAGRTHRSQQRPAVHRPAPRLCCCPTSCWTTAVLTSRKPSWDSARPRTRRHWGVASAVLSAVLPPCSGGATALPPAQRLEQDLLWLRDELGADSVQFFDHNFFDREVEMVPILEVMAKVQLPWWLLRPSGCLAQPIRRIMDARA